MPAITLRDVSKSHGPHRVLRHLDLGVAAGHRLALVGPSGCGKSTVLGLMAGLLTPDEGTVEMGGQVVARAGRNLVEPEARHVGMVFQDLALWPHMSVRGNLEFGLKAQGVAFAERRRRVMDVLEGLHMEEYADRRPGQLSGGQQQRVAIGRALVLRPSILLMDEPLSSLDEALATEVLDRIVRLQEELRFTLVHVTHDLEEARRVGQAVVVMAGGRIVQTAGVIGQA